MSCDTVSCLLNAQSENIKLNPTISSACEPDVHQWCPDVTAGQGKVCMYVCEVF